MNVSTKHTYAHVLNFIRALDTKNSVEPTAMLMYTSDSTNEQTSAESMYEMSENERKGKHSLA